MVIKEYKSKYLDEELFRYRKIDYEIAVRELELISRESNEEANIGGGRGNKISKPTEEMAIKLADDITLKNLKNFKETVNKLISELDDQQKLIFKMRWITLGYSWNEIGERLFISTATIYRKREAILEKFEELLGKSKR